MSWYNSNQTERERQLERQMDDQRYDYEQQIEQMRRTQREEQEQRRREYNEMYEYNHRQADNWREALSKQSTLCREETNRFFYLDNNGYDYFAESAKACDYGLKVWKDAETQVAERRKQLLAELELLDSQVNEIVADRIDEQFPDPKNNGAKQVASALREGGNPSDWLNW